MNGFISLSVGTGDQAPHPARLSSRDASTTISAPARHTFH